MDKDSFLLIDRIKEIQSSFINNGWLTIKKGIFVNNDDQTIYCCLIDEKRIKSYRFDNDWKVTPTSEGKPSVYGNGKYQTYADKGIEPFIFSKHFNFNNCHESFSDISEEFVLYFKLYEKGENKQNRIFYFIDDVGDLVEVIQITPNEITIKLKYLKEYISIRKMYFAICFDFMRRTEGNLAELNIEPIDEIFKNENYFYSHLIRPLDFFQKNSIQSWIRGKLIIDYDKKKTKGYHFEFDNQTYEQFIVGYDNDGNEKLEDCSKTNEKYFVLTYFKKEVLNKYYNEPTKYEIDGWSIRSNFFSLKIDNNIEEYVAVFIIELGYLPHKEQLHWKQYNFMPAKTGISNTYYKTMIEGSWAEHPETADLYFKFKYEQFNKKWENKFGWRLYKSLSKENEHCFKALHLPTTNNIKAFCEQVLSIVIITIDSLNEKEISKNIVLKNDDKGITKFEKFLKLQNVELPKMFEFLRNLQSIRSGLIAHRFSESNKEAKKAIIYFGLNDKNLIEVAKDIFEKSIFTFNTLEKIFVLDESIE